MMAASLRKLRRGALLSLALIHGAAAFAAEIAMLSAGAVEPGIRPALAAFEQASGHRVSLSFAAAPQIRQRIGAGERFDVVIAPPAVLDELARTGKVGGERVGIGRVGIGVAVRAGAPVPDIGDAQALKRALLDADSVVYNRASTGLYFETLVETLGLTAALLAKTTRPPDGAAVMEHLVTGNGREIGFGAITEIGLFRDKGLRFVGPLPAPQQNFTRYLASATTTGAAPTGAPVQALLQYLRSPATQAGFKAAGIDPAPE